MVGAGGDVKNRPETTFLMTYADNAQPKPDLLAAAVGKVFLGVQLTCAECHDHPFAPWTQDDFWGVAAYFGRLRNTGTKGPPWVLTEDPDPMPLSVKNGGVERPVVKPGGVIVVPSTGGNKGAGREVRAKLLGGEPRTLDDEAPARPAFVAWLTGRDNPYFARAFVNRAWAQLFGRGIVNPVDNLHADNPASHPALLDLLAREFADGGFDAKHVFRCVCNSRAYQRSSRPAPGNAAAAPTLFARMAVKPVGPEAVYDSLQVVYGALVDKNAPGGKPFVKPTGLKQGEKPMKPEAGKPGEKPKPGAEKPEVGKPMPPKPAAGKPGYGPANPREEFALFFRGQGGVDPAEFAHGIPQFLRRMNGDQFNAPAPVVSRLVAEGADTDRAVEALFLTALSRRPTADERALMAKYIATRPTPADGYAGVLWVLLNSSEFVLNR
jgi:hypothetical protein